jgi:hypothetical protein
MSYFLLKIYQTTTTTTTTTATSTTNIFPMSTTTAIDARTRLLLSNMGTLPALLVLGHHGISLSPSSISISISLDHLDSGLEHVEKHSMVLVALGATVRLILGNCNTVMSLTCVCMYVSK